MTNQPMTTGDVMHTVEDFAEEVRVKGWAETQRGVVKRAIQAYAAEQVAEYKLDAERYRWLRDEVNKPTGTLTVVSAGQWSYIPWSGDNLSGEIDAAIRAQEEAP